MVSREGWGIERNFNKSLSLKTWPIYTCPVSLKQIYIVHTWAKPWPLPPHQRFVLPFTILPHRSLLMTMYWTENPENHDYSKALSCAKSNILNSNLVHLYLSKILVWTNLWQKGRSWPQIDIFVLFKRTAY